MATTREYTDYLNDQVDIAPVNSQEELQAAELIENLFAQHGLETQMQEFEAPIAAGFMSNVYLVLLFVGVLLSGFVGTVVMVVGLILAASSFVLYALSRQGQDLLGGIGPKARSQNVIGVHHATGPNVVKGNRPIVIVAHYDTPRENFLYGLRFAKWQPLIKRMSWPIAIAALVMALVQPIPLIPMLARHVIWILGVVAALPLLLVGASAVYERFAPCTTGASDNKASVAAMLGVLDKVRPAHDDAKEWAATHPQSVRRPLEEDLAPLPDEEDLDDEYGTEDLYDEQVDVAEPDGEAPGEDEELDGDERTVSQYEDETGDVGYADVEIQEPETVRRGADLLQSLQVLPEDCEIVYEGLVPREELLWEMEQFEASEALDEDAATGLDRVKDAGAALGEDIGSGLATARDGLAGLGDRISGFFGGLVARIRGEHGVPDIEKADIEEEEPIEVPVVPEDLDEDGELTEIFDTLDEIAEASDADDELTEMFDALDAASDQDSAADEQAEVAADEEGPTPEEASAEDAEESDQDVDQPSDDVAVEAGESTVPAEEPTIETGDREQSDDALDEAVPATEEAGDETEVVEEFSDAVREEVADLPDIAPTPIPDFLTPSEEAPEASDAEAIDELAQGEPDKLTVLDAEYEVLDGDEPQDAAGVQVEVVDIEGGDPQPEEVGVAPSVEDVLPRDEGVAEEAAPSSVEDGQEDEPIGLWTPSEIVQDEPVSEGAGDTTSFATPVAETTAQQEDGGKTTSEVLHQMFLTGPSRMVSEARVWERGPVTSPSADAEPEVQEATPRPVEAVDAQEPNATVEAAREPVSPEPEPMPDAAQVSVPDVEQTPEASPQATLEPTAEPEPDVTVESEPAEPTSEPEVPVDPNATVVMETLEGVTFSSEQDVDEHELKTKDVSGLTTVSVENEADVEDSMPAVDESIPKPRAVDDPEWGKSTFKPSGVSAGRRAMLLDLPDPSVLSLDPLGSPGEGAATDATDSADQHAAQRLDLLKKVPSPTDGTTEKLHEGESSSRRDTDVADAPSAGTGSATTPEDEAAAAANLRPYNQGKAGGTRTSQDSAASKRKRRLGKRKKDQEEQVESMGDWLGLGDDFDAKKDGRQIGSWEHFSDDEDDTRGSWKGGATLRSDLRGDDGSVEPEPAHLGTPNFDALDLRGDPSIGGARTAGEDDDASVTNSADETIAAQVIETDGETMEELREAVLRLGDDDLIAHDIWFVGVGASTMDHAGIKEFLKEHRRDIRGAFLVNLDSVGAGTLTLLTSEGAGAKRRADRRLGRMITNIADALHINIDHANYSWGETDATPALQQRVRVSTIMGMSEDGVAAHSRTALDEPEYLDDQQIADVADIVAEVIRRA